jgi:hypothetical protein
MRIRITFAITAHCELSAPTVPSSIPSAHFCGKTYVDDVERQDLLDFATDCLKQGQKGKSIYNKLVVISQVMKQHGKAKLLNAADWPSFVETVRPIYEDFDWRSFSEPARSPRKSGLSSI